jgi:hypothetical protein
MGLILETNRSGQQTKIPISVSLDAATWRRVQMIELVMILPLMWNLRTQLGLDMEPDLTLTILIPTKSNLSLDKKRISRKWYTLVCDL